MSSDKDIRRTIIEDKHQLSETIIELLWEANPSYKQLFDSEGKARCLEDIKYHLMYLSDAVQVESYYLFQSYVGWVKILFNSLGIPNNSFLKSLEIIKQVISDSFPPEETELPTSFISRALEDFSLMPLENPTALGPNNPLAQLGSRYLNALLKSDRNAASALIFQAVEEGTPITDLYLYVFQAVQIELGRLWQMNKVTVAEEHYCTAATQLIMSRLYPYIFNEKKNGRIFVGACVGDELHELGVRMISDFFELSGWDTYFLGANTPESAIIDVVKEKKADILGIGVTITYNIHKVENIIKTACSTAELSSLKILVGGYPFNLDETLWKRVGADGYAKNAQEAVQKAEQLLGTL